MFYRSSYSISTWWGLAQYTTLFFIHVAALEQKDTSRKTSVIQVPQEETTESGVQIHHLESAHQVQTMSAEDVKVVLQQLKDILENAKPQQHPLDIKQETNETQGSMTKELKELEETLEEVLKEREEAEAARKKELQEQQRIRDDLESKLKEEQQQTYKYQLEKAQALESKAQMEADLRKQMEQLERTIEQHYHDLQEYQQKEQEWATTKSELHQDLSDLKVLNKRWREWFDAAPTWINTQCVYIGLLLDFTVH